LVVRLRKKGGEKLISRKRYKPSAEKKRFSPKLFFSYEETRCFLFDEPGGKEGGKGTNIGTLMNGLLDLA